MRKIESRLAEAIDELGRALTAMYVCVSCAVIYIDVVCDPDSAYEPGIAHRCHD